MQIIAAAPKDLEALQDLLKTCELPADDISVAHLGHFFVIKDGSQVVGSVGLEKRGELGLLRSLALPQSLRGQGVGHQLVKRIEDYARAQKITALYLLTTTADKFFTHLGYQTIPRESAPAPLQKTAEFQSICPASAVCMYKNL